MQTEIRKSRNVIKSKFNRILWILCVGPVLFSLVFCCLPLAGKLAGPESLGLLTAGIVVGVVIGSKARKILIDRDTRTITFRNLVPKRETVYHFDELDGFVEVYVTQKNGEKIKVVYLVKDRKFCEKLSGSVYSNLDELEGALASLKFLGVKKLNLARRIAILRKRPVIF